MSFSYDPALRQAFKAGTLGFEWKERYPELFDDDDLRLYRTQYKKHHFCEWYAAILFHRALGYRSMSKYGAKVHKLKRPTLKQIVPTDIYRYIVHDWGGMPDLIVFPPNFSTYFFCEVKGPGDRLQGRQPRCAQRLYEMSSKRVLLLSLYEESI
jgi:hypothetical protein